MLSQELLVWVRRELKFHLQNFLEVDRVFVVLTKKNIYLLYSLYTYYIKKRRNTLYMYRNNIYTRYKLLYMETEL